MRGAGQPHLDDAVFIQVSTVDERAISRRPIKSRNPVVCGTVASSLLVPLISSSTKTLFTPVLLVLALPPGRHLAPRLRPDVLFSLGAMSLLRRSIVALGRAKRAPSTTL
jgi:hypothetical protein